MLEQAKHVEPQRLGNHALHIREVLNLLAMLGDLVSAHRRVLNGSQTGSRTWEQQVEHFADVKAWLPSSVKHVGLLGRARQGDDLCREWSSGTLVLWHQAGGGKALVPIRVSNPSGCRNRARGKMNSRFHSALLCHHRRVVTEPEVIHRHARSGGVPKENGVCQQAL